MVIWIALWCQAFPSCIKISLHKINLVTQNWTESFGSWAFCNMSSLQNDNSKTVFYQSRTPLRIGLEFAPVMPHKEVKDYLM